MSDTTDLIAEARARTAAHARQNPEGSVDLAFRLADRLEGVDAAFCYVEEVERPEWFKIKAERDRLQDAVDAVRDVHFEATTAVGSLRCLNCGEPYPCPTVAALDEHLGGDRG